MVRQVESAAELQRLVQSLRFHVVRVGRRNARPLGAALSTLLSILHHVRQSTVHDVAAGVLVQAVLIDSERRRPHTALFHDERHDSFVESFANELHAHLLARLKHPQDLDENVRLLLHAVHCERFRYGKALENSFSVQSKKGN